MNRDVGSAEFDPERLWAFLTRCKWSALLLGIFAGGAWVGGLSVPPDYVSKREIGEYRRNATIVADGFVREFGDMMPLNREQLIEDSVWRDVERARWETRRAMQNPIAIVFWVSVVVAVTFHEIRSDPGLFDATLEALPGAVSRRIPYFLGRWRLEVRDCDGEIVVTEIHRTARAAIRSAGKYDDKCKRTIAWDDSAYYAYRDFRERVREKSG